MTGQLWIPGAERVAGPHARGGSMSGGPARAVHHITYDALKPGGKQPRYEAVRDYLVSAGYEPTLMIDPWTGRISQFCPANRSSYALRNAAGGVETNRQGTVCIQIEWFFSPGAVRDDTRYDTLDDTPLAGMDEVLELCESWGIPAVWPAGRTIWKSSRSAKAWAKAGHFGHSQVPENTHTDPGPLTLRRHQAEPTTRPPAKATETKPPAPTTPTVQEDDDMPRILVIDPTTKTRYIATLEGNSGTRKEIDAYWWGLYQSLGVLVSGVSEQVTEILRRTKVMR